MTRLYVPPLRTRFALIEDWTFPLHYESRNTDLQEYFKVVYPEDARRYIPHDTPPINVTIPKGTILSIDRYYIKNGGSDYDSITFRAWFGSEKKSKRFWAKLKDTHSIDADFGE